MPLGLLFCILHEQITAAWHRYKGKEREYTPGTPGVFILISLICGGLMLIVLPFLVYLYPTVGTIITVVWASLAAFLASKMGFL